MGGLVDSAAGLLSRRLVVTTWIPLFVLLAVLALLAAAGTGWSSLMSVWSTVPADLRVLAGLACLAVTTLLAQVLNAVRPGLIQIYEGYWPARLVERYRGRHEEIHRGLAGADPWPAAYPRAPRRVLPTRLGNVLRAAEEHPRLQYGIPAVIFWPRLYSVLPEMFRATLASAAAGLELMITMSFLGLVLAVAGTVVSAVLLPWWAAPLVLLAGVSVFWFGYLAAVRAALPYANQVRAAFDVHRWKLLQEAGLRLPTAYGEERAQWNQLAKLWAGAGPDSDRADLLRYPFEQLPPDPAAGACTFQAAAPGPAPSPPPPPVASPVPSPPAPATAPAAPASTAPADPRPLPSRGARLGRDLGLAVLLLCCVTVAVTVIAEVRRDEPVTARHGVPAFHQLAVADLKGPADRLIGRYTVAPIGSGAEVDGKALGPKLAVGALDGRSVVTLACASGTSIIVRRGDTATLRWTPDKATSAQSVDDVLLLAWLPGERAVLAVRSADVGRLPTSVAVQLARG
ncbi:hypothetical protein GCM10022221_64950 [Actinocorallia aurea]